LNTKTVSIRSAFPEGPSNFIARDAREWVKSNSDCGWRVVDDPSQAELILFLEHHPAADPLFLRVLLHPWRRKWPDKCWLFHDADAVVPLMQGIYPSLERRFFRPGAVESWIYVTQFCPNEAIQYLAPTGDETYLYSFVGACRTHPVRSQIINLKDSRAMLQDTSNKNGWELSGEGQSNYHEQYARTIQKSKFVLCPRGFSPASYRLLEAMKTGRVPVIISDDWPLPSVPFWNECAILVPESEVSQIPQLLRKYEPESVVRGEAARKSWETWCADPVKYGRLLDQYESLAKSRKGIGRLAISAGAGLFKSRSGCRALWRSVKSFAQGHKAA